MNTLFMYGKPGADDEEGIYRSTDGGKTWVCINTDHLYGGTGNGNYLVGDMNEFGKVYMSTVGCGIICGYLSDGEPETQPSSSSKVVYGDANCDGNIDMSDVVIVMQACLNPKKYGTNGTSADHIKPEGEINGNVDLKDGLSANDALYIQQYTLKIITSLPIKK